MVLKVPMRSVHFAEECEGLETIDLEASERKYRRQVVAEMKKLGVKGVRDIVLYYILAPCGDIRYKYDPGLTLVQAEGEIPGIEERLDIAMSRVWDRAEFWVSKRRKQAQS